VCQLHNNCTTAVIAMTHYIRHSIYAAHFLNNPKIPDIAKSIFWEKKKMYFFHTYKEPGNKL